MADEPTFESERSIDTVIRGFTDAELALREVSGAVERIRSASEQLDASRADQAAARAALGETTAAVITLGEKAETMQRALADTSARLADLDPERLWRHLEDQAAALRQSADQLEEQRSALRRLRMLVAVGLAIGVVALALVGVVAFGPLPAR
jgi:hypothetical protein